MSELERALVLLGRELELPATPDLAAAVTPRVRRRGRRRWLVPVLVTLLALAVALAVPGARAELLRFFHLGGVSVTLVDELPPLREGPGVVGTPTTLAALPFRPLLPYGEPPDLVLRFAPEGAWLVYGPVERPRLLLAELRYTDGILLKKVAASGNVEWVDVGGEMGLWITGPRHPLYLPGGVTRSAGNTLIFQRGDITVRIEAQLSREEAVRLALGIR